MLVRRAIEGVERITEKIDYQLARVCFLKADLAGDIYDPVQAGVPPGRFGYALRAHLERDPRQFERQPYKSTLCHAWASALKFSQAEGALLRAPWLGVLFLLPWIPAPLGMTVDLIVSTHLLLFGTGQRAHPTEPIDDRPIFAESTLATRELVRSGWLKIFARESLLRAHLAEIDGCPKSSVMYLGLAALLGASATVGRLLVVLPIEIVVTAAVLVVMAPYTLYQLLKAKQSTCTMFNPLSADLIARERLTDDQALLVSWLDAYLPHAVETGYELALVHPFILAVHRNELERPEARQFFVPPQLNNGGINVHRMHRDPRTRRSIRCLRAKFSAIDYPRAYGDFERFVARETQDPGSWLHRPLVQEEMGLSILEACRYVMTGQLPQDALAARELREGGRFLDAEETLIVRSDGETMSMRDICALVFYGTQHIASESAQKKRDRHERGQALIQALARTIERYYDEERGWRNQVVCNSGIAQHMVTVLQGVVSGVEIDDEVLSVGAYVTESYREASRKLGDAPSPSAVKDAFSTISRRCLRLFANPNDHSEVRNQLITIAQLDYDVALICSGSDGTLALV